MKKLKTPLRYLLSVFMMSMGVFHFARPEPFLAIMPEILQAKLALVYISGVAEFMGGAGLLFSRWQVPAAWGLVALYIAVFPANINQAVNNIMVDGVQNQTAAYIRLPFQALFIAWAYWYTRREPANKVETTGA